MSDVTPATIPEQARRWRPLASLDRRVVGVLVEKAKTTPEAYPLSVNALRSGCNQKNNRYPLMEVEIEDVEESLDRLRGLGAIVEVQGGGRVPRFRHCLYEWLGVEKVELAVMTELLLRGAQTEGELRGRAARMEPIADLGALRPVLVALRQKGLLVSLSPEGRGHVVTHALYEPRELEKLRAEHASGAVAQYDRSGDDDAAGAETPTRSAPPALSSGMQQELNALRTEVETLRTEVAELRRAIESLR
ncbi:MAG: DUF480 domain-containing protein [Pirellulales bacterium]